MQRKLLCVGGPWNGQLIPDPGSRALVRYLTSGVRKKPQHGPEGRYGRLCLKRVKTRRAFALWVPSEVSSEAWVDTLVTAEGHGETQRRAERRAQRHASRGQSDD